MTVFTRTSRRMWLCCILLILNLAFIWGNSLLPSEISAAFSQWVKDLLSKLTPGTGSGGQGHGLLRKIAHFAEFLCLGMCLAWLWGMRIQHTAHSLLPAFGCGFAAACVDETIQRFVPGRSCSFTDVMIDSGGVLLGVVLLVLLSFIKNKNKHIWRKTK